VRGFIPRVGGALVLGVAVVMVAFVVGMRRKSPLVRNAVRKFSRATRGFTVGSAGTPGSYASIVRHAGRTSGRVYETPVQAAASDDGFVIALPYGTGSDWVKNVLAAGKATIISDGGEHEVDQPEIVGSGDAARFFAAKDQRTQRLFGVDEYLRVHATLDLTA